MGGVDAQAGIGGNDEGADIQGGAGLIGHPFPVHGHQRLDRLHEQVLVDGGDAQPLAGVVESSGVVDGAEELDAAVGGPVGLQALKDLLRVVENHAGRIQGKADRDDAGVMPALVRRIVHDEQCR